MKVVVLSSGSKGNTTYVETETTRMLIDIGNSCKYVKERLKELNIDPKSIDGILITHTHKDHIKGLEVFTKQYGTKVYCTDKMFKYIDYIKNYEFITADEFEVGNLKVNVIKTSHDTEDSNGYILSSNGHSLVYITDTGYINQKYFESLTNHDVYILESNHDIEMLNNGPYPYELRKRIYGDKGHLSNVDCSKYLTNFIGDRTKCIMLAHLSEENNDPNIAYQTLIDKLKSSNKHVDNIIIAKQNEVTEFVEV